MIFPERLNKGDTVGLVAPSFPIKEEELSDCVRLLKEMGYEVKVGRQLTTLANFHNYLAGEGKDRAADINKMFADPEVKAIFCVRGGYGSSHVMDYLDYDVIRANPKIFVGYSDITNLLSAFQMYCGMVVFHGPMVCSNMRKDFDPYTRGEPVRSPEYGGRAGVSQSAGGGWLCGHLSGTGGEACSPGETSPCCAGPSERPISLRQREPSCFWRISRSRCRCWTCI